MLQFLISSQFVFCKLQIFQSLNFKFRFSISQLFISNVFKRMAYRGCRNSPADGVSEELGFQTARTIPPQSVLSWIANVVHAYYGFQFPDSQYCKYHYRIPLSSISNILSFRRRDRPLRIPIPTVSWNVNFLISGNRLVGRMSGLPAERV